MDGQYLPDDEIDIDSLASSEPPEYVPQMFSEGGEVEEEDIQYYAKGGDASVESQTEAMNKYLLADEADTAYAPMYPSESKASEGNTKTAKLMLKKLSTKSGGGGKSKRSKEMSLETGDLSPAIPELGAPPTEQEKLTQIASARSQYDALEQAYKLKAQAAQRAGKGLMRPTFNTAMFDQPTLERPGPLMAKTFAKGGEADKEDLPGLYGVSDYAREESANMFPEEKGQWDRQDSARHMLAAATLARKYGPRTAELAGQAHELMASPIRFIGSKMGVMKESPDYAQDIHNNRLGIELASKSKSQEELLALVRQMALQAREGQTPGKASTGKPIGASDSVGRYGSQGPVKPVKMAAGGTPTVQTNRLPFAPTAMVRPSTREELEKIKAEYAAYEPKAAEYNAALEKYKTDVYNPYQTQAQAYNAALEKYKAEQLNPYQTQVDAYNAALAKYTTETYDPYSAAVDKYNKARAEWALEHGPRPFPVRVPVAPAEFSMAVPTAPGQFSMAVPTKPADFAQTAPTAPSVSAEDYKAKMAAAKTDTANRQLALNVAMDPEAYGLSMPKLFANGGAADKKDPELTGINRVSDFIAQRLPASSFPTSGRTFLETVQGKRDPITEGNFSPEELSVMKEMIALKGGDAGDIQYGDYHALAKVMRAQGKIPASTTPSLFSISDSLGNVQTTLGRFKYGRDAKGNLVVRDTYDFNPPRDPNSMQEQRTAEYGAMGPYSLVREYAGEKIPPGRGREININLGKPVKRAEGSPAAKTFQSARDEYNRQEKELLRLDKPTLEKMARPLARTFANGGPVYRAEGSPASGERLTPQQIEQLAADQAALNQYYAPKARVSTGMNRQKGPISKQLDTGEAYVNMAKGVTELPYDLLGAPRDISNMIMTPFGYGVKDPVMGSDWIKAQMTKRGIRPEPPADSTAKGFYTAGELLSNLTNPAGVTRAGVKVAKKTGEAATNVAKDFQEYNRQLVVPGASYISRPPGGYFPTSRGMGEKTAEEINNTKLSDLPEEFVSWLNTDDRQKASFLGLGPKRESLGEKYNRWKTETGNKDYTFGTLSGVDLSLQPVLKKITEMEPGEKRDALFQMFNQKAKDFYSKQAGSIQDPLRADILSGDLKFDIDSSMGDAFPQVLVKQAAQGNIQALRLLEKEYDRMLGIRAVVPYRKGQATPPVPGVLKAQIIESVRDNLDSIPDSQLLAYAGKKPLPGPDGVAKAATEVRLKLKENPNLFSTVLEPNIGRTVFAKEDIGSDFDIVRAPSLYGNTATKAMINPQGPALTKEALEKMDTLPRGYFLPEMEAAIDKGQPILDAQQSGYLSILGLTSEKLLRQANNFSVNDLQKMSFPDFLKKAYTSTQEVAQIEKDLTKAKTLIKQGKNPPAKAMLFGVKDFLPTINDMRWVKVTNPEGVKSIAAGMNNSIGSYATSDVYGTLGRGRRALDNGEVEIYSLYDKNHIPQVTVEYATNKASVPEKFRGKIVQLTGNGPLTANDAPEKFSEELVDFVNKLKLSPVEIPASVNRILEKNYFKFNDGKFVKDQEQLDRLKGYKDELGLAKGGSVDKNTAFIKAHT